MRSQKYAADGKRAFQRFPLPAILDAKIENPFGVCG
jgi:hypothetical protein